MHLSNPHSVRDILPLQNLHGAEQFIASRAGTFVYLHYAGVGDASCSTHNATKISTFGVHGFDVITAKNQSTFTPSEQTNMSFGAYAADFATKLKYLQGW